MSVDPIEHPGPARLQPGLARMQPGPRLRFGVALLGIASLGVVLRLAYVAVVSPHVRPGLDSVWYSLVAQSLAARHLYSDPSLLLRGISRPTANFPPLFPTFLAGLYRAGVTTRTGYEIAGAFCGGVTIILTGVLGRRISGRVAVGLVAAGLVAICPALIAADASVMAETIAVPLSVAVLIAATWARSSGSCRRWAVVGALAGLVVLARSEALAAAVLLVPAAVVAGTRTATVGRRLGLCAVALAATAAVVMPWAVRNVVVFNPPVLLSSNGDSVVAGANCASVYHGPQVGLWDFACTRYQRHDGLGEARYARTLGSEGARYALDHATRVPVVVAVRVARAWGLYNPRQQVRAEAIESRSLGWQQAAWPVSVVLLALALPGLAGIGTRRFELVVLGGPVVLASLVAALTWGDQRFVLSAVPALAIAATLAVGRLVRGRTVPGARRLRLELRRRRPGAQSCAEPAAARSSS